MKGWRCRVRAGESGANVRCCCGIEENVSVLEVLGLRAVLQVLLERVAPVGRAHGRDGRLVDDDGVLGCHGGLYVSAL